MSNTNVASFYHTPYYASSVVAHAIYEMDIEDRIRVVVWTEAAEFSLPRLSGILVNLLEKHDTHKRLTNFKSEEQRQWFHRYLLDWKTQIYCSNFMTLYVDEQQSMDTNKALLDKAHNQWNQEIAPLLVQQLGDHQYFLGDIFTAFDCLVGIQLVTADILNILHQYPTLQAYLGRLRSRPSFARLYSKENMCFLPNLTL
eukprot:gene7013-8151_t